jgi:hypothetical protein
LGSRVSSCFGFREPALRGDFGSSSLCHAPRPRLNPLAHQLGLQAPHLRHLPPPRRVRQPRARQGERQGQTVAASAAQRRACSAAPTMRLRTTRTTKTARKIAQMTTRFRTRPLRTRPTQTPRAQPILVRPTTLRRRGRPRSRRSQGGEPQLHQLRTDSSNSLSPMHLERWKSTCGATIIPRMLPSVVLASSGKQMDLELNVLLPQSHVAEEGVMVSVQEWFCRMLDLRQPPWGDSTSWANNVRQRPR